MQRTARPTLKRPRHPLRPWLLPPTRTRVTRRRRAARPRPRPWITATCRCRAGRRLLTPAIRMATQWPDIGIGRLRRTRCAAADAGRRTQVLFVARRNSGTPLHAQRRRLHGLRPPGVVWDDHNKAVVKAEGDIAKGKLEESRTELLWGTPSHRTGTPSSAFGWITGRPEPSMVGFRHPGPRPYWFELEATGYVGSGGRTALRVEGSYELLLTQRLILEPRAELQFYGKDDRNAVSARAWPKRLLACACAMNSVASSPLYRRGTGGQLRTHRGLCACRRRPCAADALGGWRAILVLEPSGFDHLMRGDP